MEKDLLYRFFYNETTFEEEKSIRKWAEASEVNRNDLLKERAFFDACLIHADMEVPVRNSRLHSLFHKIIVGVTSVAAVVCITIIGTMKYVDYKLNSTPNNIITVPQGQRVTLTLADGTKVWLNSNTCMSYPQTFQGADNRIIKIDGEGYFEVTKDKKKPFIVNSTHGKIEVMGTKFYITDYSKTKQFEASLIEGQVKVSTPSSVLVLEPNAKAVLINNRLIKKKIDDIGAYRWREGLYCFTNKSFNEVLKQFELYFDVKFIKLNNQIENPIINGKFRLVDGVDYALNVLQNEISFTYKRDDKTNLIYLK